MNGMIWDTKSLCRHPPVHLNHSHTPERRICWIPRNNASKCCIHFIPINSLRGKSTPNQRQTKSTQTSDNSCCLKRDRTRSGYSAKAENEDTNQQSPQTQTCCSPSSAEQVPLDTCMYVCILDIIEHTLYIIYHFYICVYDVYVICKYIMCVIVCVKKYIAYHMHIIRIHKYSKYLYY